MINVAIIGLGVMGLNHYRILKGLGSRVNICALCDAVDMKQFKEPFYTHVDTLLDETRPDAVFIATPTFLHREIALKCIDRNVNLFIEKPVASTVEEASEIAGAIRASGVKCAVGYVERFNPVVQALKQELRNKEIYSLSITRVGPFPPRIGDVGVLTDLSVHDIDLIRFITHRKILKTSIFKSRKIINHDEDNAVLSFELEGNTLAEITTNWLTPFTQSELNEQTAGLPIRLYRTIFRKSLDYFGMDVKIVFMKRYITKYILEDLDKKIILLTGPRQSGKTTLSKMLKNDFDYFNYDNIDHRSGLQEKSWDRSKPLVIFDELHKLKNWKSWLKGIYDTEGIPPSILVTGSARLDTYKKVGDSLAGRFFQFRLHPLDLKEICTYLKPDDPEAELDKLLSFGGFPEPFLNATNRFYNRWKKSHLDIILKQDLIDVENVQQITQIETLIQLLKHRVGSPVSYNSLARDLQCSDKTVKRWLTILENMYVLFKVPPFHKNIARAIQKAPKFYFYDTGQVPGEQGIKLENAVACAIQKELHFREDCLGEEGKLYYVKNKDGKEIDFCISKDDSPFLLIEVKWNDSNLSPNFEIFKRFFPDIRMVQLSKKLDREKTFPNRAEIRRASKWLSELSLS